MRNNIDYFDTDHLIVYIFLAAILFVGLYVSRKSKDINDYALAGNSYGMTTLVITFLATGMGAGSTLGLSSNVFEDGIIIIVAGLGTVIASLLVAFFVIYRDDKLCHKEPFLAFWNYRLAP